MTLCPKQAGFCEVCNRRVRWADVQTCRFEAAKAAPMRSCRQCVHRGDAVLAPNGEQVGSRGCNCTAQSVASGVLWWTCGVTGQPVAESKARSCPNYSA